MSKGYSRIFEAQAVNPQSPLGGAQQFALVGSVYFLLEGASAVVSSLQPSLLA